MIRDTGRRWWQAVCYGLITCCLSAGRAPCRADWSIEDFDVAVEVGGDGWVEVSETLTVDFREERHGIFREIPIRYATAAHMYALRFRLLEVTDEQGTPWNKKVTFESNRVKIRIGDPEKYVRGRQIYRIRYRIARAIVYEGDHAVLRWNATGDEWRVPIARATVAVQLPAPLRDEQLQANAWTGSRGSTRQDVRTRRPDQQTIAFETGPLQTMEGITVEVAMPADLIQRPSSAQRLAWWFSDNFLHAIFPATLAFCWGAWWFAGRDLPGGDSIVVHYEPPQGLSPAEVGTLIDERVDLRDISASIIDLAVRGYLRLEEVKKETAISGADVRFVKLQQGEDLKPFERTLFNQLFSKSETADLSSLKEKFYPALPKVRSQLYKSLAAEHYFDGNPSSVRVRFAVVGVALVLATVTVAAVVQFIWIGRLFPVPLLVSTCLSALTVVLFSRVMPRKTRKGRLAWEQSRGLEEFIRRAEADAIRANEQRGVFERLLPFAILFGLTERWAEAFRNLYQQPPDWYQPYSTSQFTTAALIHNMNRDVNSMNQIFPSQPRTASTSSGSGWSSGGFSGGSAGGGFGGGGGGAW